MDQNIKNRLVGISVIFALAVIFLPMILDGSGVREEKFEVVIPPQPLVSENQEFDSKIIELNAKVDALPELEPRFIDENSAESPSGAAADSSTEQKNESVTETESAPGSGTQQSQARIETASIARIGGDSWVLQVGSFQERKKALAQRDILRRSNIAAVFIEQFKLNNKSSFRVRLGPFINRDQTKVAQNKIKAKHDIDGIIMKYER